MNEGAHLFAMADPQFEQFREAFDKLPQHIKAPTYCYRLAHDIALDALACGGEDDVNEELNCNLNKDQLGKDYSGVFPIFNSAASSDFSKKDSLNMNDASMQAEEQQTDKFNKDCSSKPLWTLNSNSSNSSPNSPAKHPLNAQSTGRKRRRLPEIPKDKPAFCASIVFKTRALSLADEICEAEKLTMTPMNITQKPQDSIALCVQKRNSRKLFPFRKCPRFADDDSSPEEKIMNTDIDSGNSTAHSPDGAKSFSPVINGSCSPTSPASSSGVSTTTLESLDATHRGLHKFLPRHHDEVEIEIGDPLYVQREADDLWCEGINLRTGKLGIFPSAYVTDVEYTDFDPEGVQVKKERFILKFLGSIEVICNKGNDVLCQAIRKIIRTKEGDGLPPHPCILEIGDQGLRMVDKRRPSPNDVPCHDYFFCLKNISFCGFHPNDYRYFGFITKHPTFQRFACHVFIGEESTRPVAEAVGRAFQRFYQKYIETAYPVEDIYLE